MSTFVVDDLSVTVPDEVVDLSSFRRWLLSDEFPDQGRIAYFQGRVWVDMSKEQIFTHNQVKNEFSYLLTDIAKREKIGRFFPDGVYLTNADVELSCQPDGVFVLRESFDEGRVRLVEGAAEGFVELEGSPDIVLEVVSRGSVEKDTETFVELYWQADILEYWVVDARENSPKFTIYHAGSKGYVAAKRQAGWQKSKVLNRLIGFSIGIDNRGDPEFTVETA
jgi:Uma2 family endonuclease